MAMIKYLKLKHDTFGCNMKVLLGHLHWGLHTKCPHSDPADKTFLALCIVTNVSKWSNLLLKTYVAGCCTMLFSYKMKNIQHSFQKSTLKTIQLYLLRKICVFCLCPILSKFEEIAANY